MYQTILNEFLEDIGADQDTRQQLKTLVPQTTHPRYKQLLSKCEELYPTKKAIKYKEKIDLAQNTHLLKLQGLNNFENSVKTAIKSLSLPPNIKKIDGDDLIQPSVATSSNQLDSQKSVNPLNELKALKLKLLGLVTEAHIEVESKKDTLAEETIKAEKELTEFKHLLKGLNLTQTEYRKVLINLKNIQMDHTLEMLNSVEQNPFPSDVDHLLSELSLKVDHGEKNSMNGQLNSEFLEQRIGQLLGKTKAMCQYTRTVAKPLRVIIQDDLKEYSELLKNGVEERSFYHVQKIQDGETKELGCGGLLRLMNDIVDREQTLELLKKSSTSKGEYMNEEQSLESMIQRIKKLNSRLEELKLRKGERVHYLS